MRNAVVRLIYRSIGWYECRSCKPPMWVPGWVRHEHSCPLESSARKMEMCGSKMCNKTGMCCAD